jgi:hypothetical protein
MKAFHRLIHDRRAMTGMVIGLIVTLTACAILVPIGVYLNAKIYSSLPALTGVANTTATQVRDNIYAAYSLSAIIPIIAAASAIIGIIIVAFAYGRAR